MEFEQLQPYLVLSFLGAIVIYLAIALPLYLRNKARRLKELRDLAHDLGLRLYEVKGPGFRVSLSWEGPPLHDPLGAAKAFTHLSALRRGDSPQVTLALMGRRGEHQVSVFDYLWFIGTGEDREVRSCTVVGISKTLNFPNLALRPATLSDAVASALGKSDLRFESEAFNQRYTVSTDDSRAAYDVLNPRVIDYLNSVPTATLEFGGSSFITVLSGEAGATEIRHALIRMEAILERIPNYVREDRGVG